ncbi:MAG TPA: SOS response-associated peptidase [Polyangia bacterium]
MSLAKSHFAEIADELASSFAVSFAPSLADSYRPRFNLAPTDAHFVLLGQQEKRLQPAFWGFSGGPGRPPLFNARSETAPVLMSFRSAFAQGRCVVPADGFYEWGGQADERRAHWLHRRDGRLLLMAGLHQDEADAGGRVPRFSVLTTRANPTLAPLHHRMPVILAPEDVERWLAVGDVGLLRPAPDDVLALTPVSNRVNSVKNDDPACRTPVAAGQAARQLRLF